MSTCNLSKIIHNIWVQLSSKRGTCLFAATFDNYVLTFKKSYSYYAFLQGCASRTSPNKNESRLCRASRFGDLVEIVAVVAKYTLSFSLSTRIPHLKDEEVFGSTKSKQNFHLGQKHIHISMFG
jgi:hypothetical protein